MRVLYFSRDCTPHDHRFLSAMAKSGHEVYFLRLEKGQHMLEDRPLPADIEPVEWRGGKKPTGIAGQVKLLGDLRRVIRQVKPDLVQAGPIQRSAFLASLTGFHPLVTMSWGYDLLHDAQTNSLWRWATRYTLRHTDCLVGDCTTIRNLATCYGMPSDRIVTFPWGVDINHFNVRTLAPGNVITSQRLPREVKSERGSSVPTFKLLSSRAFEPIYGVDVIARAFVIAAKKCPELYLTLLGSGSQEAALRQAFLVGGASDRVEFKGKIGYHELPSCYQAADIYLSASHSDGSSISLLEAFACGTPAIVSDIPGNCEWVTPGENGWLFPDGDADALAIAIQHAFEKRQSLPKMGENARRVAEARADWAKNFPMLEKAFQIARNGKEN